MLLRPEPVARICVFGVVGHHFVPRDSGQKGVLFLFVISKSDKQPSEAVDVPLGKVLTHFKCKQRPQ